MLINSKATFVWIQQFFFIFEHNFGDTSSFDKTTGPKLLWLRRVYLQNLIVDNFGIAVKIHLFL